MTLSALTRAEHIGPYLLGTYEAELHDTWNLLLQRDYSEFVDVGANFGYYAVGLARRFPNEKVVAFDVDWWARKAVAEMSAANGTTNLSIESWCDPSWLARHLQRQFTDHERLRGVRGRVVLRADGCPHSRAARS